jgi:DNA-binding MarR family transcriptional regulator
MVAIATILSYYSKMSKDPTEETVQAWIKLHRTHQLLLEKVESTLKNKGLPPLDWYDVLIELYREKSSGLRQYEIGKKILLNKHNLSRLIDRLEKKQLVGRHACEEDGRGNRIKITPEGEKLLKQVWPVYGQSIHESFGVKLASKELTDLSRIFDKLLDSSSGT